MIKQVLFAICFLSLISSCKEEEEQHLSREEMTEIMTDIHLAEIYSTMVTEGEEKTTNKNIDSLTKYYKMILQDHGITQEEFSRNVEWYSSHPKEMDSVYVNILTEINKLEGLLNTEAVPKKN